MICRNCGKELKETDKFCSKCGTKIELKTDKNSVLGDAKNINDQKTVKMATEENEIKLRKIFITVLVIVIVVVLITFISILNNIDIDNNNNSNNTIINEIFEYFKSDEKSILGTWEMDTSSYGVGLDKISNLDGIITKITFFSDGTCIVNGVATDTENGIWSIVDGQLKVQGTFGGMFWNLEGIVSEYDIKGDILTVYNDDGDNYVYYRE